MSEPTNQSGRQAPTASDPDPLGAILDTFLDRFRRGERPSLTELVGRHPELADEIREVLPALVEIEQLGTPGSAHPVPADRTTSLDSATAPGAAHMPGRLLERLGDYRILRELGSGGMGVVYEAVRESLHSHVALKVMHDRFRAHGTFVRRFQTEARSAARLHHSNIVSVFDYGEHDGVCYYVMQYIAGHGLDAVLEDVRRLRGAESGHADTSAARAADAPLTTLAEAGPGDEDSRAPRAATSPRRLVTLGLLSGRYALGPPVGSTSPASVETETAAGSGGAATERLGFGLVLDLQAGTTRSSARPADDASSADPDPLGESSALLGKTEERYYREVARLIAQAADALGYAHKRGVLHRDIKPSNLLIDAMGNLWGTDFGLAKFEGGEDLSRSRDVVGTLRYMAPERFRGVSDRRCDIYALGATLYEMLTLRQTFAETDQLRLIDRIVNDPPEPLRRIDRRIPRDLETIALMALAKEPADRFATADEMAAELRRFVENRPIHSRPIPAYERTIEPWVRPRSLVRDDSAGLPLASRPASGGPGTKEGRNREMFSTKKLSSHCLTDDTLIFPLWQNTPRPRFDTDLWRVPSHRASGRLVQRSRIWSIDFHDPRKAPQDQHRKLEEEYGATSIRGREIASMNAMTHGLTAKVLALPGEDPRVVDIQINQFVDYYQPAAPGEMPLVEEAARARRSGSGGAPGTRRPS